MNGRRIGLAMLLLVLFQPGVRAADLPASDPPGAHDLDVVPRLGQARILSYDQAADEEARLPSGRFRDFGFVSTVTLEGRVTRIAYGFAEPLSTISIMNHYLDVLKGAGFKIAFFCDGAEGCGGFNFGEALTQPMVEAHPGEEAGLVIDYLHPVGGDIRYVLATLDRPTGAMTLALAVARHVRRPPGLFVEAVEQPPGDPEASERSATEIASALRVRGRIALYSLHFGPGQAVLRPDSRGVLSQVSTMLHADPSMRLIVVGHCDGSLPMAQAMPLSSARADAVMQALIRRWNVPPAQVTAMGVGSAAPLASNADQAGRALNQRIELVLQ